MPDFTRDVLTNILAGVILAGLTLAVGRYFRLGTKLPLYWRLLRQARLNFLQRYADWSECAQEIARQIRSSKEVLIINIKGRELTFKPEPYRAVLQSRVSLHKRTRVLLQSPKSSYVNETVSKAFGWPSLESYREDLVHSIRNLLCLMRDSSDGCFEIALYDTQPILRLFVFDDEMYVGFYSADQADELASNTRDVWRFRRRSDLRGVGWFVERYFESLWEKSVPAEQVIGTDMEITIGSSGREILE
jgi:hypothetical protein